MRAVYEHWSRGDFKSDAGLFGEDFEWRQSPEAVEPATHHGPEGATRMARGVFDVYRSVCIVAVEFVDAGDQVLVVSRIRGTARGSGIQLDRPYVLVWTFRDGEPVAVDTYRDREEAVQAIASRTRSRLSSDAVPGGRLRDVGAGMPTDRVAILEGIYGQWARGNFRAGMELFDPQVTMVMNATPDPATYRGAEAVREYMRDFLKQWERYTIEAMEMLPSGDNVLVIGMQRAVAKASGVELELPTHTVWSFRDARVVRMHWTLDRQEALEVAGLQQPT